MKKLLILMLGLIMLSQDAIAFMGIRDKDHLWAGFGIGFPTRYDADKSTDAKDLSGPSSDFPVVSMHYFFQYAPLELTEYSFFGVEFGGLITPIKRTDDRNEKIRSLYVGALLDVKKLLEFKVGYHSSDFDFRVPEGDSGLYFGAAYNAWRGDGARLQLDYRLYQANENLPEAEFANIMLNLIVSYRNFIN